MKNVKVMLLAFLFAITGLFLTTTLFPLMFWWMSTLSKWLGVDM